jgi:response regulator RpfG family c-di-GMP phosphodiesterase
MCAKLLETKRAPAMSLPFFLAVLEIESNSVVGSTHPHAPQDGAAPRINQKLLRALVAEGAVSQSDAEQAELFAKRRRVHVEEALLESGLMDEGQLLRFQAALYRTYFVSTKKLSLAPISDSLLRLVTQRLAARLWIFPVKYDARTGELSILTVEPDDPDVLKGVQFATRVSKVRALVARPAAIAAAIRLHFMNEVGAFAAVRHTGDKYGGTEDRGRRMPDMMPSPQDGSNPPMAYGAVDPVRPATGQHAAPHLAPPVTSVSILPHQAPTVAMPHATPAMGMTQGLAYQTLTGVDPKLLAPTGPYQTADNKLLGLSATQAVPAQPAAAPAPSVAMHDYIETLNVLVALLEQDRGELRGHSMMVVRIARRMCERLGLTPDETDSIVIASYLHDLGKVSQFHLTALNVAQYENHRVQAKKSYLTPMRLFEAVRLPDKVSTILAHMYERLDGQGFPDRLSAKEIPLGSRLLAVAETYADLTGQAANAYRRKLTPEEAFEVLNKHRGKLFDATLLDVLKLVVMGGDLRAKLLADRRRALLVDPDAEESTVLELRLVEHGFDVVIARNSSDAENELASDIDIVISEIELKPLDGFALLQKVRASGNEVPFVFLSQKDESDIAKRSFELGAGDFITKPASPDVVALKVNRVLDGGAARKRKPGGVSGSLTEMALPDMVQILFHGRKSGLLVIHSDGKRGEIQFSEGQIFDATFGETMREEAFYEMLRLKGGDFELDPNFRAGERKIALAPESLLLEGMRRLDEAER